MHELSIAEALIGQVRDHAPREQAVLAATLVVGPLQGIEPDAMQFAWEAVTQDTDLAGVELRIRSLPYRWHCPACGRHWQSEEVFSACTCGYDRPAWKGGDELRLESLEVEDVQTERMAP